MQLQLRLEGLDKHLENCKSSKEFGQKNEDKSPEYIKFYTVFQYDRLKFRRLLNAELEKDKKLNRKLTREETKKRCQEIFEKCLILDENGNPKRDSDEPSVYRYFVMQKIYTKLYDFCGINPFSKKSIVNIDGLVCHIEDRQAEVSDTWQMSIRERLQVHIRLLRALRSGKSIKDGLKEVYPILKGVK